MNNMPSSIRRLELLLTKISNQNSCWPGWKAAPTFSAYIIIMHQRSTMQHLCTATEYIAPFSSRCWFFPSPTVQCG
ncbi:unnamed protein product [Ixodes pacificus]